MKFSQETGLDGYTINAYNEESVTIIGPPAGERSLPSELILNQSFILTPLKLIRDWPPSQLDDISQPHFGPLLELNPEMVILGVGSKLRFPDQSILKELFSQGIGVEVMDSSAACRTYNILAAEGREVAAAIIIDKSSR